MLGPIYVGWVQAEPIAPSSIQLNRGAEPPAPRAIPQTKYMGPKLSKLTLVADGWLQTFEVNPYRFPAFFIASICSNCFFASDSIPAAV